MRNAINNNPIVQIGLLGFLGVLVGVIFMSNMGGSTPPPEEEETVATETAVAPAAPTTDGVAPLTPDAATSEVSTPAPAGGATPFEASKGLPAEVVDAHKGGDVVVLLVMEDKGIEDEALRKDVENLNGRGDTSVFVAKSSKVSKYSRIAEGVSLDRVPAIIVLHPLDGKLSGGEAPPMPDASVTYGYRGAESVTQAVEDALYKGNSGTYAP